jgi:SAM-dependent methyltransferase
MASVIENRAGVPADVIAGAANYNLHVLRRYDRVLYVNCKYFWGCERTDILAQYQEAIGTRHLEIGVGSGYCPATALFPVPEPEITLVDLNPRTLDFAARRLAHLNQRRFVANALDPLEKVGITPGSYDSVATNLLLHCIPGDIKAKESVLRNAATALKPGGKLVGSTVLAQGVRVSRRARFLMDALNRKRIFHNLGDGLDDLEHALDKHFADHRLRVRGCMALFTATAG